MDNKTIKPEYYIHADMACRNLYQLELNINPEDRGITIFTDEERIFNKSIQQLFWVKFDVSPEKNLEEYTGKMFAAKFLASNGRTQGHEHFQTLPKKLQRQIAEKMMELTNQPKSRRLGDRSLSMKCDNCGRNILELTRCSLCKYTRYCDSDCRKNDLAKHQIVCEYIRDYLGYAEGFL